MLGGHAYLKRNIIGDVCGSDTSDKVQGGRSNLAFIVRPSKALTSTRSRIVINSFAHQVN
jgi:hypothetical protein